MKNYEDKVKKYWYIEYIHYTHAKEMSFIANIIRGYYDE
jgi:hypothetical protein